MARSPSYSRAASAASWATMVSQPIRSSSSMAVPKATAPTTLGEPASSRSGGSVQITSSRSTRSTAPPPARKGSPCSKALAWPDERAGAEGRVELVAAEGHEVRSRRQRAVWGQLRRVEQDGDAPRVRLGADLLDRGEPARHVGRTRHGQQRRRPPVLEHLDHVGGAEGAVGAALHPAPCGHPGPGQQVGVVLDHGGGHHVVGAEPEPVGQVVDGFGGVAHQDDDVVAAGGPPGEAVHAVAGPLVGGRGPPGLVAGAAVHARVPGQELVDPVGHRLQRRRRGGAVEVAVGPFDAIETGNRQVGADERRDGFLLCHAVTIRSAGVHRYPAAQR